MLYVAIRRSTVGFVCLVSVMTLAWRRRDALAFRRAPVLRRSRREALGVCASPRRLAHMRLSYLDGRHSATDVVRVRRPAAGVLPFQRVLAGAAANRAQRRHRDR